MQIDLKIGFTDSLLKIRDEYLKLTYQQSSAMGHERFEAFKEGKYQYSVQRQVKGSMNIDFSNSK